MIKQVTIENYKSIETLELNLGRVNVFIGENGCGKSNILEAIALCSASVNNKLDNEFLTSRGIRVSQNPKFMRSTFSHQNVDKEIRIVLTGNNGVRAECSLQNDNKSPYSKWVDVSLKDQKPLFAKQSLVLMSEEFPSSSVTAEYIENASPGVIDPVIGKMVKEMDDAFLPELRKMVIRKRLNLEDFIIYSPENSYLRTFEKEGQILPLGIRGEGLLTLLKVMASESKESLREIKEGLELISWFKDVQIPDNLSEEEQSIYIQDKYIHKKLKYFNQINANEGFLFLLFYFSLFVSKETPRFFAIDNIEASLNPKLCWELMRKLVLLAKKHDKQVILTTHSPSVLDGLDLEDDEQKLFVIYRNKLGHTKAMPVEKPKVIKGEKPLKLSEEFLRGYLGGLPKNF